MKYKKFNNYYFLRIDSEEEIVETITNFCTQNKINLAKVTGIGAVLNVKIRRYDAKTKKYISKAYKGDFEVISANGNITIFDKKPFLHMHIALSGKDYKVFGGHLMYGIVNPTFEVIIEKIKGKVNRKIDSKSGLKLWNL